MPELIQPIRKEQEKLYKRQKLCSTAIPNHLDKIMQELENVRNSLQNEGIPANNIALNRASEVAANGYATIQGEQKEVHSIISKFSKTLDKTFRSDIGKAANPHAFDNLRDLINESIAYHFYREGRVDVGEIFEKEANVQVAPEMKAQFADMFRTLECIKQRNLEPALTWARAHAEQLQRSGPSGASLEFKLHRLQYLSLLQAGKREEALAYSRQFFSPFAETHIREIQRLLGCILFLNRLEVSPYADLFAPHHWQDIQHDFTRECCGLMGLSYESAHYVCFTTGTMALPTLLKMAKVMEAKKTEWSQQDELPVEVPLGRDYAYHSIFVCPVAKEQVTDANPAMILQCGHVICEETVNKLARGNGRFKCPYCPQEAMKSACKKIHF